MTELINKCEELAKLISKLDQEERVKAEKLLREIVQMISKTH